MLLAVLLLAIGLDFRFFTERVQPIFIRNRTGGGRCYDCHSLSSNSSAFQLQKLDRDGVWSWEQARRNFENARRLVIPGRPGKSRLLLHPLEEAAGGDPFHSGGKFWNSQQDPEWQVLAAWVSGTRSVSRK